MNKRRKKIACDVDHTSLDWLLRPPACVPIREFTDSNGVNWRVWSTSPSHTNLPSPDWKDGWLTFECASAKRRLVPIPDGWDVVPLSQLEALCAAAEEMRRGRPSLS